MNLNSMSNIMSSICSFLVIFCVISNVHGSVVKRTTCSESTTLNSTHIQAVLDAHNLYRSQAGDAADMIKLVWSDWLASIAQDDANLCNETGHSQCDPNKEMARNYHYLSSWPNVNATDLSWNVEDWHNYGLRFYNSTTGYAIYEHYNEYAWDYKRLMWASSSEIGCGMSTCDLPSVFGHKAHGMFVCYYNPAGNFTSSQKPYRQGTPCSQCKQHPGSWRCKNNLCVAQ